MTCTPLSPCARRLGAVAATLALALLGACSPSDVEGGALEPREDRFSNVLIFGIDGATWDVIDPMIERGELPNLARLVEEGVRAPLMSLEDFRQSVRIWNSIATGVEPEKHGIEDFVRWDDELGSSVPISSDDRRAPAFWNLLDRADVSVGVIGCWATWPAERLGHPDSFIVTDQIFTAHKDRITYPEALAGLLDYKGLVARHGLPPGLVEMFAPFYDLVDGGVRVDGIAHLESGFDTTRFLVRQDVVKVEAGLILGRHFVPDVLFNYVRVVDSCQHFFWPDDEHGGWVFPEGFDAQAVIEQSYRQADEALGRHLDALRDDAHVIVVSDHGGRAHDKPMGVIARPHTGEQLGLDERAFVDSKWYRQLGIHLRVRGRDPDGVIPPEEFDAARAEIRERLLAITDRDGNPVLHEAESGGRALEDLLFNWNIGDLRPSSEILVDDTWRRLDEVATVQVRTGRHKRDGILAVAGPAFRAGAELTRASVLDVLPTLMYLLDQPVARDLDGAPLLDLFEPAFRARRSVRWVDTYGPRQIDEDRADSVVDEETLRHLESMGYLSRPANVAPGDG